MATLILEYMPATLRAIGESLVFAHGDLGDENVLVDAMGKVGVVDFNESGYFEQAADFMDISDESICDANLDAYAADETLRARVRLRRDIRPVIVLLPYLETHRDDLLEDSIAKTKAMVPKYAHLI